MEWPLAVERQRHAGQRQIGNPGMRDMLEDAERVCLLRVRDVRYVRHRCDRDTGVGELSVPRRRRRGREPCDKQGG